MHPSQRSLLKIKKKQFYILVGHKGIKSFFTEKPRIIEIFPTLQCNLRCRYCDRGKVNSILKNFNEIKILYNNLKKDPSFRLLNFRISGGEPALYPKVNKLISFLHDLYPYAKVDFLTNLIKIEKLTKKSLSLINLSPSIYPSTEKILRKNKYVMNLFKSQGIRLKSNVLFHEDMESYGKLPRKKFDSLSACFLPTLVCGTKQVFPCCRAHRLEQRYQKIYHLYIHTPNLYGKLKDIIKNTDLCTHCPRVYRDAKTIFLKNGPH